MNDVLLNDDWAKKVNPSLTGVIIAFEDPKFWKKCEYTINEIMCGLKYDQDSKICDKKECKKAKLAEKYCVNIIFIDDEHNKFSITGYSKTLSRYEDKASVKLQHDKPEIILGRRLNYLINQPCKLSYWNKTEATTYDEKPILAEITMITDEMTSE